MHQLFFMVSSHVIVPSFYTDCIILFTILFIFFPPESETPIDMTSGNSENLAGHLVWRNWLLWSKCLLVWPASSHLHTLYLWDCIPCICEIAYLVSVRLHTLYLWDCISCICEIAYLVSVRYKFSFTHVLAAINRLTKIYLWNRTNACCIRQMTRETNWNEITPELLAFRYDRLISGRGIARNHPHLPDIGSGKCGESRVYYRNSRISEHLQTFFSHKRVIKRTFTA